MATYEQRISALERKISELYVTIQNQSTEIEDLHAKLSSAAGYAYAIAYDSGRKTYQIYLPYGSLTVNSRVVSVGSKIGWVDISGEGPIYVNVYRRDVEYYGTVDRRSDNAAEFTFCVGNIISETNIERFINGAVVLVLNDEVRGAFDVVEFNGEKFMYLPRNGTINYGGYNYTVKSAEAIGGWMKVNNGVEYWCWAVTDDPYAYVTSAGSVPTQNLRFSFKVGSIGS